MKLVENCTIIGTSLLGENVEGSDEQKYNHTRSLCHYGSLALEFYDAWHEGDGNHTLFGAGECFFCTFLRVSELNIL